MQRPGMVIKFAAKADEAEAFAQILDDALALVAPEPGTTPWLAVRAVDDPNTFFVVDLYADEAALERHVNGPAAALVLGEGRKHLVSDPEIAIVGLLAGKDVEAPVLA
jgi:quinol monooxygenase YgiN